MIGQVTGGLASRARADRIDAILGEPTRRYPDGAVEGLPRAWQECDLVVSHLALGATTRLIAPLLTSKTTDPGVVVVDEAGRFVVPLVGGHAGGANDLARRLADGLGATAVVTTATDATGVPGLDTLGWPCSGAVAEVTRALLDGRPVALVRGQRWPLPALPGNVQVVDAGQAPDGDVAGTVLVTDEVVATEPDGDRPPTVVLNPPSLVARFDADADASVDALHDLLTRALADAALEPRSLASLTCSGTGTDRPALAELARRLQVPLLPGPVPPALTTRTAGTATCAVARIPARGRLTIVGIGPGARDLVTPRARQAIRDASIVVGYRPYVAQVKDLLRPGTRIVSTPMGKEAQRTASAIDLARRGNRVVLVSSGDPAVYAMASPTLEQGTEGIEVDVVPGVTAGLAASALLGAPLGHDHATISLSDLHTGWETILLRLRAAAEADLVTVLYNPRSRTRLHHLPDAMAIFAKHRPPGTPVAVVEDATRPGQAVTLTTIDAFDPGPVTMNSLVIVGSSTTRYLPAGTGRTVMVTPRDYRWMPR